MFSSINKRLVAVAKFLVAATKNIVDPNFVAVTKPFFSVCFKMLYLSNIKGPFSSGRYENPIFSHKVSQYTQNPVLGSAIPVFETKTRIARILVIFQDKPMFSHIIQNVSARAFH